MAQREAALLQDPKSGKGIGIDYIFFRRFSDERSSQVAAYVVDNSSNVYTREQIAELHHRVWLNGTAPLLYVEWSTQVDVLRCAAGPEFWNKRSASCIYKPAESIGIASAISCALDEKKVRRFSAFRLSNGTFWEDPENVEWACADKSAHKLLIQAATDADKALHGATQPVMRRLLLLFIFTKYLEDRGVFPVDWFDEFATGATTFIDVLKSGQTNAVRGMLTQLKTKFNGDIFELPGIERALSHTVLSEFVTLLEAKTINRQMYLWKQFSFRYVPVEVISHLYQHFAQSGTGAIFTPPFVADLILDHVMPYDKITGGEQVLDPTCGSGIFLVGAFRRLIHQWQSQNNWDRPSVPLLKEILKRSIFGVEKLPEAANVAALNLALAVCDALQPKVIWNHLTFDKLIGRNLFVGDFFENLESLRESSPNGFSTIVGNPPFDSKLTLAAKSTRRKELEDIPIPDGQIAYRVMEECATLLGHGSHMCLIQPSGFLYNAKTRIFTARFLRSHTIETVLDFVSIRNLFESADTKTVALVIRSEEPSREHEIRHLTFRRTKSVHERLGFELDHYDYHLVSQVIAETSPWIWKVNLLGGGRLTHLAGKIMKWPTLKEYLSERGWTHGEGFTVGNSSKEAKWLTGKRYLPIDALTANGIRIESIGIVNDIKFEAPREPARFTPPMFLIGENEILPSALWLTGDLTFRNSIVSINAQKEDEVHLAQFARLFEELRNTLRVFSLLKSSRALIGKSTSILKRDIEELPWPEPDGFKKLSWWEEILLSDASSIYAPLIRIGQNSLAITESVNNEIFEIYSNTFVRLLGSIYSNLHAERNGTADGVAYQAFTFGKTSELDWPDDWSEHLRTLLFKHDAAAFRTNRIVRFYEGNTLIIIKPDRLRHWIPSTAIRDADETLVELQQQGF
ncbi:MAG: class I SAM-dependent DNA methyltransferase [Porticoccaceae bacterium]